MANNTVTISGMFGTGHTYFADSPVVIEINGLQWPGTSPFNVVRVEVIYTKLLISGLQEERVVGDFRADTGGQTTFSFDISEALKAIWVEYDFTDEVSAATLAAGSTGDSGFIADDSQDIANGVRKYRTYNLVVDTEYLAQDGEFTTTSSGVITGGQCAKGRFTEWERSLVTEAAHADVSYREHENLRNGDASTKPTSSPERVGSTSITSWVDVQNSGTKSVFYAADAANGAGDTDRVAQHAPVVLRDSQSYVDFLFVNRRGAVETCSALTMEAGTIGVETQTNARVERPSFIPSRSLMASTSDGRRTWNMSSGHQTREWAEWWAMEFLTAKKHWMLYKGRYVPVIVEPAQKQATIFDRTKQQMPSIPFTVTLALEG